MRRLATLFVRGLAVVGTVVLLVTATPLVSWWASALAGPWRDPTGDTLILLGGSILDNGTVGVSSYWRSVYAAWAYQQGPFRQIVISGGGPAGRVVSDTMSQLLQCNGVPSSAISLERRSSNTRENALYTRQLLGDHVGAKVLMTSDYHMLRASRAFKKVGVDVLPRPFPDALKRANSYAERWGAFIDLSRETVAIGYYFARGWI